MASPRELTVARTCQCCSILSTNGNIEFSKTRVVYARCFDSCGLVGPLVPSCNLIGLPLHLVLYNWPTPWCCEWPASSSCAMIDPTRSVLWRYNQSARSFCVIIDPAPSVSWRTVDLTAASTSVRSGARELLPRRTGGHHLHRGGRHAKRP